MKKLLFFLILTLTFTYTYSDETSGMEYKNLGIKLDTHETTLATSEKVIPVYTEIKYNFNKGRRVSPFVKGDLGFSYVNEMEETSKMKDMTANNYYSMGAGLDMGNFTMEAAYVTYQLGYVEEDEDTIENRFMFKVKYRY